MKIIIIIVFAFIGFMAYQYRAVLISQPVTITISNEFPVYTAPNTKRCKGFAIEAPIETLIEFEYIGDDKQEGSYYHSIERDCILFLKNEYS